LLLPHCIVSSHLIVSRPLGLDDGVKGLQQLGLIPAK
jgi:hypothetical protein